jgi:hypothetical protein
MSPLNAAICTTISYTLWVEWHYLKNNYLTLRSKSHKGHYGTRHIALWSCTHIPNIIDLSRKTKMLWPGQENTIQKNNYLTLRSKSHEGHYGMWHTALWSCTHNTKYNWPIWKDKKVMVRTSFAEKKWKRKKKSD